MMDKFQMLESERFAIDPCGEIRFYALDGKKVKTKSIHKTVVKYHQASSCNQSISCPKSDVPFNFISPEIPVVISKGVFYQYSLLSDLRSL